MISAYLVCKLDVCARNPKQPKQGYAYTKSEENVVISNKKEKHLAEKEGMKTLDKSYSNKQEQSFEKAPLMDGSCCNLLFY